MQVLGTEMYKVYSHVAPDIVDGIFEKNEISYNFRNNCQFIPKNIRSVYHGSETISYLGSKIWNLVSKNIKDAENVLSFKAKIIFWNLPISIM